MASWSKLYRVVNLFFKDSLAHLLPNTALRSYLTLLGSFLETLFSLQCYFFQVFDDKSQLILLVSYQMEYHEFIKSERVYFKEQVQLSGLAYYIGHVTYQQFCMVTGVYLLEIIFKGSTFQAVDHLFRVFLVCKAMVISTDIEAP